MIHWIKQGKNTEILSSGLVFALLYIYGCYKTTRGIDLTDEGMYLSTPLRFALGDVPFRDEIMNVMRPFDVLMSPLFHLWPSISLLGIRILGLSIFLGSIILLYLFLRRHGAGFLVALSGGITFLIANIVGVYTPSYNLLSFSFLIVSLVLWLWSCTLETRVRKSVLSILGGLTFFITVFSYFPMALLILVPVLFIIINYIFHLNKWQYVVSSLLFISSFSLFLLITSLLLWINGLIPDFISKLLMATGATQLGQVGVWTKIIKMGWGIISISTPGIIIFIGFLLMILIPMIKKVSSNIVLLSGLVILFLCFLLVMKRPIDQIIYIFALILAVTGLILPEGDKVQEWTIIKWLALTWGLLAVFVYGISSDGLIYTSYQGIPLLFLVGMVDVSKKISINHDLVTRNQKLFIGGLLLIFMAASINYNYQLVYRDANMSELTEPFKNPKLKGIYSTPERVRAIDDLVAYLDGKVKPGDLLLAYNYVPLLYYLTDTRPAYGAAWARDDWPLPMQDKLLTEMIDRDRIPTYCIKMLAHPVYWKQEMVYKPEGPLNNFVKANYHQEKIIYPFMVLHINDNSQ